MSVSSDYPGPHYGYQWGDGTYWGDGFGAGVGYGNGWNHGEVWGYDVGDGFGYNPDIGSECWGGRYSHPLLLKVPHGVC